MSIPRHCWFGGAGYILAIAGTALVAWIVTSKHAPAQEIKVQLAVVCDTQTQMEKLIAVLEDDVVAAAKKVSAAEGKDDACVIGLPAYFEGKEVSKASSLKGVTFGVVKILVIGQMMPNGLASLFLKPPTWFMLKNMDKVEKAL